jgi:hypothetical protein
VEVLKKYQPLNMATTVWNWSAKNITSEGFIRFGLAMEHVTEIVFICHAKSPRDDCFCPREILQPLFTHEKVSFAAPWHFSPLPRRMT